MTAARTAFLQPPNKCLPGQPSKAVAQTERARILALNQDKVAPNYRLLAFQVDLNLNLNLNSSHNPNPNNSPRTNPNAKESQQTEGSGSAPGAHQPALGPRAGGRRGAGAGGQSNQPHPQNGAQLAASIHRGPFCRCPSNKSRFWVHIWCP